MAAELDEAGPAFRYREMLACASAASLVAVLLIFWAWFPKDESRLLGLLVLLPVFLPYAFIPLRLYGQRLRSGLTLAITMGCALVVPGIYLVRFAITWDSRWWVFGNLIVALLMQLVLIVVGVKAYIRFPRLPRADLKVLAGPAYGFSLFALFFSLYSPVPLYITKNEHSAMKYLETAAVVAFLDAEQHGRLYPEALGSLGPNSNRACTAGLNFPPNGYVFEYCGAQPSSTFQGCTRFQGFTMSARPVTFGKTGIRSFCVDGRSLSIHFTSENRPARTTDPVDSTLVKEHRPQ
jgi:hypothetical protein